MTNQPKPPTLLTMRVIWAAMVFGQVIFLAVTAAVLIPQRRSALPQPQPMLVWVNSILLLTSVPVTYIIRRIIISKPPGPGSDPGVRRFIGNVVFWSGCEGPSFFGLIVATINANLWPTIVFVVIAIALQAITFPTSQH